MNFKTVILASCCLILLLSSCSVEKRLYRKGYYWQKVTQTTNSFQESEFAVETVNDLEIPGQVWDLPNETTSDVVQNPYISIQQGTSGVVENNTLTLIPVVVPSAELDQNLEQVNHTIVAEQGPQAGDDGGNAALSIIGWCLIGLGLLTLLFLSILGGILVMVLGLVFVLVGRKKGGSSKKSDSDAMVDVVYLKNGSIVRGTIIEQVPGESLKIQTADGSVFFYKMEEIDKITKEKSTN